jgi:hypothetical protein
MSQKAFFFNYLLVTEDDWSVVWRKWSLKEGVFYLIKLLLVDCANYNSLSLRLA